MSQDGRTIPPGEERIAAASHRGLLNGSPLVASGMVVLAVAAIAAALAESVWRRLVNLMADGLVGAVSTRPDHPGEAVAVIAWEGAAILAPFLIAVFSAAVAFRVARIAFFAKGRGRTAVPLPEVRRSSVAESVVALAAAAVIALVALRIFSFHFGDLSGLEPASKGNSFVSSMFLGLLAASGVVMVLAGWAQGALRRARVLEDLRLSKSEAAREERASAGDRRVRNEALSTARGGLTDGP